MICNLCKEENTDGIITDNTFFCLGCSIEQIYRMIRDLILNEETGVFEEELKKILIKNKIGGKNE